MNFNKTVILSFIAFIAIIFSSCLSNPFDDDIDIDDNDKESEEHDKSVYVPLLDSLKVIYINWGDEVQVSKKISEDSVSIVIENNNVYINSISNDTVEYVLSGKTEDGMIKINSEYDFNLVFNEVSIKNSKGAAINIQSKKRAYMYIYGKTRNYLEDGFKYVSGNILEDEKAALFSEGKIIICGDEKALLNIKSNSTHAICSDSYINVSSGNIELNAFTDGIHANDEVSIDGGDITIYANSDGIECESGKLEINDGLVKIICGDKGLTTSYRGTSTKINPDININGGSVDITVTQENGKGIRSIRDFIMKDGNIKVLADKLENEGIESKRSFLVSGGKIYVESYDNGLNSALDMNLSGGEIYSCSLANDGIDSNGKILISGGIVMAIGAGELESGFDCGSNIMSVKGGVFVGIGSESSKPNINVSTQPSIILNKELVKGQLVNLSNDSGDDIITFQVPNVINSTKTLISSPLIKKDSHINVFLNGSCVKDKDVYGIYLGVKYEKGDLYKRFMCDSMLVEI